MIKQGMVCLGVKARRDILLGGAAGLGGDASKGLGSGGKQRLGWVTVDRTSPPFANGAEGRSPSSLFEIWRYSGV